MSAKVFLCPRGHDLSRLYSYRRTADGRRLCKRCAIDKLPARLQARHAGPARDRRNARRRESRDRMRMQLLGCAESIRITNLQAEQERNAA